MARTRLQAAKQQNDDLATERIGVITRKMAVASQSAAGALTAAVAGLTSTAVTSDPLQSTKKKSTKGSSTMKTKTTKNTKKTTAKKKTIKKKKGTSSAIDYKTRWAFTDLQENSGKGLRPDDLKPAKAGGIKPGEARHPTSHRPAKGKITADGTAQYLGGQIRVYRVKWLNHRGTVEAHWVRSKEISREMLEEYWE